MEIPLRAVITKKSTGTGGKYPSYGITIPKAYINSGLLDVGDEIVLVITERRKTGLKENSEPEPEDVGVTQLSHTASWWTPYASCAKERGLL